MRNKMNKVADGILKLSGWSGGVVAEIDGEALMDRLLNLYDEYNEKEKSSTGATSSVWSGAAAATIEIIEEIKSGMFNKKSDQEAGIL